MFNLSGSEMVFLLLIALVVLGPEKLPEAVRKFGKTYGELKKMSTGFQTELRDALDEPMKEMRETAETMRQAAGIDFEPLRVDPSPDSPAISAPPALAPATPSENAPAAASAAAPDGSPTESPTAIAPMMPADAFPVDPQAPVIESPSTNGRPTAGAAADEVVSE